jgi:hypothetical protein
MAENRIKTHSTHRRFQLKSTKIVLLFYFYKIGYVPNKPTNVMNM